MKPIHIRDRTGNIACSFLMVEERERKDAQEAEEKARNAALRGKVGFAKLVWKESVAYDFFK